MLNSLIKKGKLGLIGRVSLLLSSVDLTSKVHPKARLNRFVKVRDSVIGKYTYVGPRSRIVEADVGAFCSISWDCMIGVEAHPMNLVSTSPIFCERLNGTGTSWVQNDHVQAPRARTSIGSDVWIGSRSIVLTGVKVGHGSVVGAGSIVTKDVPPFAVVVGVPAKQIKSRFSEEVVAALLNKRWWDAADDSIRGSISTFAIEDPSMADIGNLPSGENAAEGI